MKKILALIIVFSVVLVTPVFACNSCRQNGSIHHNNINSNNTVNNVDKSNKATAKATNIGVNVNKNTNKVNTDIDNSNRNNVDVNNKVKNNVSNTQGQTQKTKARQDQAQSANNEGITVEGDTYSSDDDSVYMAPPSTTPMVGTTSAQVTTPFGGIGGSKDAQYAIYKHKMDVTEEAFKRGYITEEERVETGKYLYKKFINANKKGLLSTIIDPIF